MDESVLAYASIDSKIAAGAGRGIALWCYTVALRQRNVSVLIGANWCPRAFVLLFIGSGHSLTNVFYTHRTAARVSFETLAIYQKIVQRKTEYLNSARNISKSYQFARQK